MGGIRAGLSNKWTTALATLVAVLLYLQNVGTEFPTTKEGWFQFGVSLALVALGVITKDATTGSRPGE
jgi:hypothetical protein